MSSQEMPGHGTLGADSAGLGNLAEGNLCLGLLPMPEEVSLGAAELTLGWAERQRQGLVLFLLSMLFCLQARGKMVTRLAYKVTSPSPEGGIASRKLISPL